MNTLSDVNALSHVHEIMAQFRGWKSEVVKEFQHEYLISIYRNSVEIPTMAPKKRAEKMEDGSKKRPAEDAVPELGTRKGPRMAYHLGTTKESEEDPGGGDIYLFARTNPFGGEEARGSLGSSGSAGSVAETEKRPAESVAERLRWKEQKARDATASGSQEKPKKVKNKQAVESSAMLRDGNSGSADEQSIERKNDLSDEDNRNWERAQEDVAEAGSNVAEAGSEPEEES